MSAKRWLITGGLAIAGLLILLIAIAWWLIPGPYERHFKTPLPEGTKLLHYQKSRAGFDVSYVFVFETPDEQLLNGLIGEWQLTSTTRGNGEPMSFVALRPPVGWLSQPQLTAIPRRYHWTDQNAERYRSVWFDQSTKRLYAEYGRW